MNAKMRIGHFTAKQPLRLRVNMASLKTILASAIFAIVASQTLAAGLPGYDTNLERWAKERLAERIGDMRGSYEANELMTMVTALDVKRGPLPLSAERNRDPIWLMATLRIGTEINIAPTVFVAEAAPVETPYPARALYTGALVLVGN